MVFAHDREIAIAALGASVGLAAVLVGIGLDTVTPPEWAPEQIATLIEGDPVFGPS